MTTQETLDALVDQWLAAVDASSAEYNAAGVAYDAAHARFEAVALKLRLAVKAAESLRALMKDEP